MNKYLKLSILLLFPILVGAQVDYTNPDEGPRKKKTFNDQFKDKKTHNPYFHKGKYLLDFNIGFPNFATILYKAIIEETYKKPVNQAFGIGPFVVRGDYFTRDKRSVGIDISYATSYFSFTSADTSYRIVDGNPIQRIENKAYTMRATRLRIVPRVTLHFYGSKKQRIDPYVSFGMGYGMFKTTGSPRIPTAVLIEMGGLFRNRESLVIHAKFGTRLQATDNLGFNFEFGYGGPLIAFGGYATF
jgi:hypothetical protein